MWIVSLKNGKYKYCERYIDPYSEKTKTASVTLEKDTPQAKKQAIKLISEKIEDITTTDAAQKNITFGELLNEWFPYYQAKNKRKTWKQVDGNLKRIHAVISDDMIIKNIDSKLITKFIDEMYSFGTYSYNYTSQIRALLSTIFKFAISRKYLSNNPVKDTEIALKIEDKNKQREKVENKYLERDEAEKIISYLANKKRCLLHSRMSEFLWLTGLRYGELQALKWNNYHDGSIRVEGTLDSFMRSITEAEKTSPKTSTSFRVVDLPDRAIEIIEERKQFDLIHFSAEDDDYIFLSSRGNPLVLNSFNLKLKEAAKANHIDKEISSHIFRHSHVSLLSELGMPLKSIMERVGHSDAKVTLKIYNHVTKKAKKDIVDALNNL
ncbi:site-specific integrase [Lactococcus lactis subsp. lactis]|nr:site-specific integrase [Lactococcus lactis subsp. lactis]